MIIVIIIKTSDKIQILIVEAIWMARKIKKNFFIHVIHENFMKIYKK